ncbi:MAG: S-layer homology domain-containing protein [Acidimicrobiales bacterium]|nr:S-layer homology domain-containing protein [Acidimicrobiales bacterium]
MTITIRITKATLAILVAVAVLAGTATALAGHPFGDVEDGKWYSEAVEWAYDNDITTGKTPTTFNGDDGVTRYEAVTFQQRYDENVAGPARDALADDISDNADDIADNGEAIASLAAETEYYWAMIDPDGSVLTSSHPATAHRDDTGTYRVGFDGVPASDLFANEIYCMGTATTSLGFTATSYVVGGENEFHTVWVFDTSEALTDSSFRFVAYC